MNFKKEYNRLMKNKKNKVIQSWIFVSVCFLVLIVGVTTYLSKDDVQKRSITYTDIGFDTPIQFQATCSKKEFEEYSNIVKTVFQNENDIFDVFDPDSVLYQVNEQAYQHPVTIPSSLKDCIEVSQKAYALSSQFDISQGALLKDWHTIRDQQHPDLSIIDNTTYPSGMEHIVLNDDQISFTDSISLDLGGIAKGYTAQICKEKLNEAGLDNGFINAGGNVVLLGKKQDGSEWTIGIQSPDSQDSLVQFSTLQPLAMVTSGDYQRYVEINGQHYGHIIDPQTKYPPNYMRSVTIIHEDSTWADAMSTTLFCMPVEEGMQFCKDNHLQAVWVCDKDQKLNIKPLFTTDSYQIYATEEIKENLELSQNFTN